MSANIGRARESWLDDGNDEHVGDAALLCGMAASGICEKRCAFDGFCFRGLGSAEVRYNLERRLDQIERDLRELLVLSFPQRQKIALGIIAGEVAEIRDNMLTFRRPKS